MAKITFKTTRSLILTGTQNIALRRKEGKTKGKLTISKGRVIWKPLNGPKCLLKWSDFDKAMRNAKKK